MSKPVMNETVEFLVKHGYIVLFAAVLAEQSGLPLPSAPFLLAAGALAGLGRMNILAALTLAIVASLLGDSLWFYLGRSRGSSILRFLCKIALEPDSCVRQTGTVYSRYGADSLLFAKFVPGLSTVAPPWPECTSWRPGNSRCSTPPAPPYGPAPSDRRLVVPHPTRSAGILPGALRLRHGHRRPSSCCSTSRSNTSSAGASTAPYASPASRPTN